MLAAAIAIGIVWFTGLTIILAPFAARGWRRRHATDAELFPEIHGETDGER